MISRLILRSLTAALMLGLLLLGARSAQGVATRAEAADAVVLGPAVDSVDVWPALRMLPESGRELSGDEAFAARAAFSVIDAPHSSLGRDGRAIWFLLPMTLAGGDGRWVLDIDYPHLSDVQVFLHDGVQVRALGAMGARLPFAHRPLLLRSLAMEMALQPARAYTLLLRVRTESAMVLPITLNRPARLQARENLTLLGQGLMLGAALCLLVYSAVHGIARREPLFLFYAGMLLGSTAFFADFHGLPQMAMGYARVGAPAMVSPLSVLLALCSGCEFIIRAMGLDASSRPVARALRGLSLIALATMVLGLGGVIDYRTAQLVATAIGPLAPMLIVPEAFARARGGDRIGQWMLFGWLVYLAGALCMVLMLRGVIAANGLTMHGFQAASAVEMLAWMNVLGIVVRRAEARARAVQGEAERLKALVHTDALTGLLNRRGMQDALALALPSCRTDHRVAVLLVDLDGFKAVNDRHGHDAGDEVLRQASRRMLRSLRPDDRLARLGGDEFVVVLHGLTHPDQAIEIGHRLLDSVGEPFTIGSVTCRIGMTVGLALAPDHASEAAALLRRADEAMYAGKREGRGRLVCAPGERPHPLACGDPSGPSHQGAASASRTWTPPAAPPAAPSAASSPPCSPETTPRAPGAPSRERGPATTSDAAGA